MRSPHFTSLLHTTVQLLTKLAAFHLFLRTDTFNRNSSFTFFPNKVTADIYQDILYPVACTHFFVGPPGFEPGQTEPKSVVLPLHHSPIFQRTITFYIYNILNSARSFIFSRFFQYSHRDSNPNLIIRSDAFYPLNYRSMYYSLGNIPSISSKATVNKPLHHKVTVGLLSK